MLSPSQIEMVASSLPLFKNSEASVDQQEPIELDPLEIEEVFQGLSFIVYNQKSLLESAVDIIDSDAYFPITRYQCGNHARYLWRVSSRQHSYICLEAYCPCRAFFDQSRFTKGPVICKHLLAIRLSSRLNRTKVEVLSNEAFVELIASDPR
jgi:predicted nucleic acid-binding Zn finger protein